MFSWANKKLTKNYNEVPLFWVDFNLNKYKKYGNRNSCIASLHPSLRDDKYIKENLNNLIDYIRDNYDMEKLL